MSLGSVAREWWRRSPCATIDPFRQLRTVATSCRGTEADPFSGLAGMESRRNPVRVARRRLVGQHRLRSERPVRIGREDKGLLRMTLPGHRRSVAIQVETINDTCKNAAACCSRTIRSTRSRTSQQGLYRLRDSDGDDKLRTGRRAAQVSGQPGPWPQRLGAGPDGHLLDLRRLGRACRPTWSIGRVPSREHRRGEKTKEGFVLGLDRDGRSRELICTGLPQSVRHRVQCARRLVHLRCRRRVRHGLAVVSADAGACSSRAAATSAGAASPASGRRIFPTTPTTRRRCSTSAKARRPP